MAEPARSVRITGTVVEGISSGFRVATRRPRGRKLRNDECVLAAGEDLLVQGALKRVNLRIVDQPMVEEAQNLHVVIIVAGRVPC